MLRYFAELSYDAIGEELDLTRSQVATLLFRAKRGLRGLHALNLRGIRA